MTLDAAAADRAAALLVRARRTRQPLDRLPAECRPATVAEALAIQAASVVQLGDVVAGWKVGGVIDGELTYGVLLRSRVIGSGSSVDVRDVPLLGMEAEIAFRFLEDVPPRDAPYVHDEIAARVMAFPAIEIVATRYRDYKGTPVIERAADCMSNGAFVVGEEQPDWRSRDLVHVPVSLRFDTRIVAQCVGGHVAGHPLKPAIDLVNVLRARGGVSAGQIMTTGTYTGLNFATPGTRVRAEFEGFRPVDIDVREFM